MKMFDRKFGEYLIQNLPKVPAVYLFKSDTGQVLYVGKAKDIRSRLRQYRNASRRKVHQKMRKLVCDSSKLEVRLKNTEQEALIVENALIRELKPPYNVDGTYSFLYPAIGIGHGALSVPFIVPEFTDVCAIGIVIGAIAIMPKATLTVGTLRQRITHPRSDQKHGKPEQGCGCKAVHTERSASILSNLGV